MNFCGCGKILPPQKWASHGGGRPRRQCSEECTRRATTVRRYGLNLREYHEMLRLQDHRCAVCKKHIDEEKKMFAVDHEHVEGFEDMSPEERKKHIRGLLCLTCNRFRLADINLEMARQIVSYLESHSLK